MNSNVAARALVGFYILLTLPFLAVGCTAKFGAQTTSGATQPGGSTANITPGTPTPPPSSPLLSCEFNGQTIASGQSMNVYRAPSVAFGSTCASVAQSITCTNGVLPAGTFYPSCSVSAAPPVATSLYFITQPRGSQANVALSSFSIGVKDQYGNTSSFASGTTCSLQVGANVSGGLISGKYQGIAASGAQVAFSQVVFQKAGTYNLTATCTGISQSTPLSNAFTVAAASASQLTLGAPLPTPLSSGQSFNAVLNISDSFGNPVPSGTVSVAMTTAQAGVVLNGALTQNTSNGVANFSGLSLTASTVVNVTLKFQSGNLSLNESVVLQLAAPVITLFSASPTTITQGASTMLSWNTTNATSIYLNTLPNPLLASSVMTDFPAATTTYILTATNAAGVTASKSLTVTVKPNLVPLNPWLPKSVNPVAIPGAWAGHINSAVSNNLIFSGAPSGQGPSGLTVCPTNGSACRILGAANGIGVTTPTNLGPAYVNEVQAISGNIYVLWTQTCLTAQNAPPLSGQCVFDVYGNDANGLSVSKDGGSTFAVLYSSTTKPPPQSQYDSTAVPQSVYDGVLATLGGGPYNANCNPFFSFTTSSDYPKCAVLNNVAYVINNSGDTYNNGIDTNPYVNVARTFPVTVHQIFDLVSTNNKLYTATDGGLFESADGATFSFAPGWPTFIDKCGSQCLRIQQIAVDSNGVLYVALVGNGPGNSSVVIITTSSDGGATFTAPWQQAGFLNNFQISNGTVNIVTGFSTYVMSLLTPP